MWRPTSQTYILSRFSRQTRGPRAARLAHLHASIIHPATRALAATDDPATEGLAYYCARSLAPNSSSSVRGAWDDDRRFARCWCMVLLEVRASMGAVRYPVVVLQRTVVLRVGRAGAVRSSCRIIIDHRAPHSPPPPTCHAYSEEGCSLLATGPTTHHVSSSNFHRPHA